MSDLDDLEAIAESTHFGTSSLTLFSGARNNSTIHPKPECSRGHDLAVTGIWRKNGSRGRRRVCIACARHLTGYKGIYRK